MGQTTNDEDARVAAFVARWAGVHGGAERANYQLFVGELCDALALPKPEIASGGTLGAYQYEGPVPGGSLNGGPGFIDLYKRGCFILEAKQSRLPAAEREQPELYDRPAAAPAAPSGAKYDQLMRGARRQAEQYAHALPGDHPPVPFIIVCDLGRAFELLFDYAGNGRGYGFFPDKRSYRIALADLLSPAPLGGTKLSAREVLRAIWTRPASIDPRARSADVTRDVARKLADVSRHLEQEGLRELDRLGERAGGFHSQMIEGTALFLMRMLFCMFAEDVGLLPPASFQRFLQSCVVDDPADPGRLMNRERLESGLAELWSKLNLDGTPRPYCWTIDAPAPYFNGGLFASARSFPLGRNDLGALIDAAGHEWKNVEPAIFGTLLEQALTPGERSKLGAHYTPRPYVERLVQATITDVLNREWAEAQDRILAHQSAGDDGAALETACGFLTYLQAQRVLDPACGTGNFLYVAMESLLRLEGDVIELIASLGGQASPTIGPAQFLGLELNPRAAVIAELVLWIGWLRWRTANDPQAVPHPVLRRTDAINFGQPNGYDAVLARDALGQYDFAHPTRPDWPAAEFIVGNPPFIGGQALRQELESDYAAAMWEANPHVAGSADLVMQWWDRAADLLTRPGTELRRFGFVTTNSITQEFNRRVVARHLDTDEVATDGEAGNKLSLVYAIPDHPWYKSMPAARVRGEKKASTAAVRIAMTVAEVGAAEGRQGVVTRETDLASDKPTVEFEWATGRIHADLTTGTNVTGARSLLANGGICHDGVKLHGKGFAVTRALAIDLGLGRREELKRYIRPYRNGKDLTQRNPATVADKMVIDLYGLDEKEVRQRLPEVYQHLLETVKPERDRNNRPSYRQFWWVFGEPRRELRPALAGLDRYIGTTDTAKHRTFQFINAEVVVDDKVVVVASDEAFHHGVLSSAIHVTWATRVGGRHGVGNDPVYAKSKTFDPFPFPDAPPAQATAIAELAEELDQTRKAALAEHPRLTMTGLYNLVEALRAGGALSPAQATDARDARAGIVRHLHDQLDEAVADAYGWGEEWRAGALAPAEIVARLVALNAERAAEEADGRVRWLRPEYQAGRFGAA